MLRRALLAVALALLATPAGAVAADVRPGNYTGGGSGDEPGLVFISIDDDETTYVASFTVRAPCEAYDLPVQARIAIPATALADDGTSTVTRPVTGTARGPSGQQANENGEATWTLRVSDDGRATGTARLRSTFTDAQTGAVVAQCDTGEQDFSAAIVPARVSRRNGTAPLSGDYLGAVGVQPLVATLRNGDLEQITVLYRSACQRRASGSAISRIVAVPRLDLRRDVIAFRARGFNRLFSADGEELVRFEIAARFGRRGVLSGTIRYRGVLRNLDGDVVARCDSGALRWRAIRD